MTAKKSGFFVFLFFCFFSSSQAANMSLPWFSTSSEHQVSLRVDMFVASTCPHCQKAEIFFKDVQMTYPWLTIHFYVIDQDKAALETFYQFLKQKNEFDFAVPSIVFCNTRWVGFGNTPQDEQSLLNAIAYCRAQIIKSGYLTTDTEETLKKLAAANWYQTNLDTNQNPLLFIPVMAVLDALTPAAIIAALALCAFLVILKSYQRWWWVMGLFLMAMAIPHYIQQMHMAFFDTLLIALKKPVMLTAIFLLIGFGYTYLKHLKCLNEKPLFFTWLVMLMMAVMIPLYQQAYTPNFALIFRQWLEAKSFSSIQFSVYLMSYHIVYVLAIALLARSFIAVGRYYSKRSGNSSLVTEFYWHYLLLLIVALVLSPLFLATFIAPMVIMVLALVSSQVSHRLLYRK